MVSERTDPLVHRLTREHKGHVRTRLSHDEGPEPWPDGDETGRLRNNGRRPAIRDMRGAVLNN